MKCNPSRLNRWLTDHAGGAKILKRVGGKDASKQFWKVRIVWKKCRKHSLTATCAVSQRVGTEEVPEAPEDW